MKLEVGQHVHYHHPERGQSIATVTRDRKGYRYNLDVGGELVEQVEVGPNPGQCWPLSMEAVPFAAAQASPEMVLAYKSPPLIWPAYVASGVAVILGLLGLFF